MQPGGPVQKQGYRTGALDWESILGSLKGLRIWALSYLEIMNIDFEPIWNIIL
jgi:hypothetical protein